MPSNPFSIPDTTPDAAFDETTAMARSESLRNAVFVVARLALGRRIPTESGFRRPTRVERREARAEMMRLERVGAGSRPRALRLSKTLDDEIVVADMSGIDWEVIREWPR
jgi:hypothetical protein